MLGAAASALSQMLSPPFRAVLMKSAGAALVVLLVVGIALQRLLAAALRSGGGWLDATFQGSYHGAIDLMELALAVLAGVGLFAGLVFLMPAVTALVAGVFADEIAAEVERTHYPAEPPGTALPVARALWEGARTALLSVLVYLCAVPFLLVAGLGAVIFFVATAYLLGREYFELAAMRFRPPAEAKALRKAHAGTVFLAGLPIAAFVSIPIVNLATPLFATAFMVHIHKRLSGAPRITIEAPR
jgi:uncharacterized protein involved in cysteine biosynthesis